MVHPFLYVFLALGLSACTEVSSPPGTGGSGGSAGSGGNGGSAGTGGDAFVCDDGTSGTEDATACTQCTNCAATGPCSTQVARCDASTSCGTFVECLNECGEMGGDVDACIDACVSGNPEGASIFAIAQNCQFCECPNNCDNFDICRDVLECDDGTVPTVDEPEICDSCVMCAVAGPCETSSDACSASTECDDFTNCEIQCVNDGGIAESCFTTCSETYPAGAVLARDASTCLCAQCPDNCSGAPGCEFY